MPVYYLSVERTSDKRLVLQNVSINQRFGLTAADLAALAENLDDIEASVAAKAEAHGKTVGATAGIDEEIQRGMDAVTFLDAMMKVVYRDDAAKLGAWKSARHVRRVNRPAPAPPVA